MELRLIQNKIYEIRGQKVMLDFDLAEIYGIETKYLKRSVKRNIERFEGEDFMFELTKEELSRCNFGTLNNQRGSNVKYMPFAFSELGVAMLSSVLKSKTAIEINRGIIRVFVAMLSSVLKSKTAIEINRGIIRVFVAMRHLVLNPPADKVVELQQEVKNLKEYIEEVFSDYNDINDDTRMQLELINQTLAELQSQKKIRNKLRNPVGFVKPDPDIL